MKRILALCALLATGISVAASAENIVNCTELQTQQEMNVCAAEDYDKADAGLNKVWKDAMAEAKSLDADEPQEAARGAARALLAGQRGWIAYRDGQCELAGWEAHGGSLEPMLVSGCLAELTRARTKQLKEFVSGQEQ